MYRVQYLINSRTESNIGKLASAQSAGQDGGWLPLAVDSRLTFRSTASSEVYYGDVFGDMYGDCDNQERGGGRGTGVGDLAAVTVCCCTCEKPETELGARFRMRSARWTRWDGLGWFCWWYWYLKRPFCSWWDEM